jgi:glycine cleavage system H lipoate-binding protein
MTAGKTIAAVESVKAAADVYSPVSGEVVASNDALGDEPGMCTDNTHKHIHTDTCVYVHVCIYVCMYV